MRIFPERRWSRRISAVAAACVAVVMSFGFPGNAQAAPGDPIIRGLPWSIVGAGNFLSSSGGADIVWHNANSGETRIWYMSTNKLSTEVAVQDENGQPIFVGLPWSIAGVGDLNGSGRDDIVWHNAATNETQVWFMDFNRIVQRATVLNQSGQPIFVGLPWSIAAVGDLNGSGRDDIVWHNATTNETEVWVMIGNRIVDRSTVFGENNQPAIVGPPWSIATVGNLNGVGGDDIVWRNAVTNETQIWFMNHTYSIVQRATMLRENGLPESFGPPLSLVAAGDFNGGGMADLVWHNDDNNRTHLTYMNTNRIHARATVVEGSIIP